MCRCSCTRIAVLVVLIAWILQAYPWMWWVRHFRPVPPVSYDGRIRFNLDNLVTPESEEEIVSIVQDAYKNNRKIRVVADGHSWSHIAQTQDIMVSLTNYRGIVSTGDQTVTVRAGTPLDEISQELDKLGLGMINLGSVAGQSIAGAISTGTHGTGLTVGNLASLVVGLRFVSGKGNVEVVSEKNNAELFRAAQVSIGMFGIITEVTLRVQNRFKLKELRTSNTLDYCLNNLNELVEGDHKYVKMWIEFYNNFCVLYQTDETNEDITPLPWWLSYLTYYTFAVSTRVTYLLPFTTPYVMWLVNNVGFFKDTTRVDVSYNIFNDYFDLPIHQEGEVIIHYNDTVRAIEAIQHVVIEKDIPVNYITEVRFVQGDEIYLSPQNGYDPGTCAITLTIYAPDDRALDYFNTVYKTMRDGGFNARFHWGKHFDHDHQEIQDLYPNFKEFADFRSQMDPHGIFVNEFLEEKFQFGTTSKQS